MGSRSIDRSYHDPLDLLWIGAAAELGMTVVCSREVFAAWDGAGTLSVAAPEDRDADDCLAQLVLHEICHALVEGPEAFRLPDWGLSNRDERHLVREHACHRLQATLAGAHGLREFFAVTTEHRPYYDALPADCLAPGDDPAIEPARAAWRRARHGPWAEALDRALRGTAELARLVTPVAPPDSLWSRVSPGTYHVPADGEANATNRRASP